MSQPLRPDWNSDRNHSVKTGSSLKVRPAKTSRQRARPEVVSKPRNDLPIDSSAYFNTSTIRIESAKSLLQKRSLYYAVVILAIALGAVYYRNYQIRSLQNEAFSTGYVLTAVCLGLAMLGVRKRMVGSVAFPSSVIGSVRNWQRVHHWLGSLCLFCYLLHAGLLTHGWLDSILAILFWAVTLSGLTSWFINKTSPKLLQAAGKSVLLSDIPMNKKMLREEAYRLALKCAGDGSSSAIADLYQGRLADYFQLERGLWYRVNPNGKKRRFLLQELDLLDRFLDDRGRDLKKEMSEFIKRRDDLDFQQAIQNRIKFWSAFHQCWMGAFIVLAIAHVALAHLYSSHW